MALLRLYRVLGDAGITLSALARDCDLARVTVRRWLRCLAPVSRARREQVERALRARGVKVPKALWMTEKEFEHPFFTEGASRLSHHRGIAALEAFDGRKRERCRQGKETMPMAQKIEQAVLEKFRLDRDPFINELHAGADVFMSKPHKKAEWLLMDAAAHQYFVALVGEVGSGKTVVLKRVLEKLARDKSFVVSRLRCVEKEETNAFSIMEALVRDFSADSPRRSREGRARQVGQMLEQMIRERQKPVLVIDEAHALNYRTLRALKRLYDETECGFRRSIAIVLVGQNSNVDKSYNLEDKLGNWDLREVSERCQLLALGGLNGELGDYLAWKFQHAGTKREIVQTDAVKLLAKVYDTPLAVNNVVLVAMNLAFEVGKDKVNAELMSEAIKTAQGGL